MRKISLRIAFLVALVSAGTRGMGQNIYTFAGMDRARGYSGDGGFATLAEMNRPLGVATGPTGNVYFCDQTNNVVRMVTAAGVITTIAGNGAGGYGGDGGAASAAQLMNPLGVALDASGNIYIADASNNRVRKVNTSGIISTIAGNGTGAYAGDGGPATAGELNRPYGVLVSAAGNIYIADSRNYVVRMINTTGTLSTFAGDTVAGYTGDGGPATAAEMGRPVGLAMDAAGNVYVSDYSNSAIRKINTSGIISTFAGTGVAGYAGDGGAATAAELNTPAGLSFDATGNLYIADYANSRIRKVTSAGIISTYAGNGAAGYYGDGGAATLAELNNPFGVALSVANNVYITDYSNDVIRRVGTPVRSITISTATGDTVCAGGSVLFTATAYADATPHYQWQVNGANVGTDMATYTYSPVRGDKIDCILDSSGVDFAVSDTLRVDSFPVAGVILGPPTLCVGSTIVLASSIDTARGLGGPPPPGNWLNKDTTITSLTRPSNVTGLTTGTDTVFFIVTNTCGSDSARLIINVINSTYGPIIGPSQVCALDTATFKDPVSGGTWTLGGRGGFGGGGNTIDSTTGLFTAGRRPGNALIVYGTPGCTVTTTVAIVPTPRVGPITGPSFVYDGGSITLADTSTGGTWSCSDTAIAKVDGSGNVTGIATGPVVITYSVTNIAGCTGFSLDTISVFTTNGVKNVQNSISFTIFPNPASDIVTIKWNGQAAGTGKMIISDVTGRAIFKTDLAFNRANGQLPVNISTLKTGVYIVNIQSENGNFTGKLVVE